MDTIAGFLLSHEMTVYLVIYDRTAYDFGARLFPDIAAYIDDRYVLAHTDLRAEQARRDLFTAPCAAAMPSARPASGRPWPAGRELFSDAAAENRRGGQ